MSASPPTVGGVLRSFVTRPRATLLRRWNWKSAVLSSGSRGLLFFATNLASGPDAAARAMLTELIYRGTTAGIYGAMTQALSEASPPRLAALAAMVLLPAVAHTIEGLVHYAAGTPQLTASLTASVAFTVWSTLFNVFAMRRGALIVGERRDSLGRDLQRLPGLMWAFLASIVGASLRAIRAARAVAIGWAGRRGGGSPAEAAGRVP